LNRKGRQFGIAVELDTAIFPVQKNRIPGLQQGFEFYDSSTFNSIKRQNELYRESVAKKGYLREVVLYSKSRIANSKNLNEDGASDQVITKKTLESFSKKTVLDVLTSQVPGFHKGPLPKSALLVYKINGALVIFVIDGVNINQQYDPVSESNIAFAEYVESFLKYILAEDATAVEIMTSRKNAFSYEKYYRMVSSDEIAYAFIEITTVSGNGAFAKKTPGLYYYKPLVPTVGKLFYNPRYNSADTSVNDFRSTIYWNPGINTDARGNADFSFYTSDSGSACLVIVQGFDRKGGLGFQSFLVPRKKEERDK